MIDGQKLAYALQIIIDIESAHQELDLAIGRADTIASRIKDKMEHLTKCLNKSGLDDQLLFGNAIYCIEGSKVERSSYNPESDNLLDDHSDNASNS